MIRTPMEERDATHPEPESVEELATEYLLRVSTGETPDPTEFRAVLPTEDLRQEFDELLHMTETAERSFPVSHRAGHVLSGRYRLVRELGAGGMGKVWIAHDEELDREVAIKVLNLLGVDTLEAEPMIMRESQLLAQMQHPNIVGVHESGKDGDLRYLVMDLVDGRSLADVIHRLRDQSSGALRGGDLTRAVDRAVPSGRTDLVVPGSWPKTVATVMSEALKGLEAAHAKGVLHRDIKPANIMLCGGGHPVLLDFGLGGRMHREQGEMTGRLYGTACYLAPEQIAAESVGQDPRTDIYQMGLVLYELLTRERTFGSRDTYRVLTQIRQGDFAPPRQVDAAIPPELEDICLKALECNPVRRYETAAAMRQDLDRFLEGKVMPLASQNRAARSFARRARYFVRRNRLAVFGAAVAVVAAGVTFVAGDLLRPRDSFELHSLDGPSAASAAGGVLATTMATERTRHVYAVLIARAADGVPTDIRPVRPHLVGSEPGAGWALEVGPGRHDIALAGSREARPGTEMCFFTVGEPQKLKQLDRAWTDLAREAEDHGREDVPFDKAERIFANYDLMVRASLPAGALRLDTAVLFDPARLGSELELPDDDLERHVVRLGKAGS